MTQTTWTPSDTDHHVTSDLRSDGPVVRPEKKKSGFGLVAAAAWATSATPT